MTRLPGFLYTRFSDGGIDVCWPSREIIRVMSNGGWWDGRPRGFIQTQIERWISEGVAPDTARRFVLALHYGGNTTAEALHLVCAKDCHRRGKDIQVVWPGDLPPRWFRNAWRRGRNLQLNIDIDACRKYQISEIENAIAFDNFQRSNAPRRDRPRIELDWITIDAALQRANDEVQVAKVWPDVVGRPKNLERFICSLP